MLHALHLHPDSVCEAVNGIYVQLERRSSHVFVEYVIQGAMRDLLIPMPVAPHPVDGLWRHTCCELFVGPQEQEAYFEFNFSPSSEWAAYRFNAYRSGMKSVAELAPRIEVQRRDDELLLRATLEFDASELARSPLRAALAAVIEEWNGRKSYWALAHPRGRPDFHHADGFVVELPVSQGL